MSANHLKAFKKIVGLGLLGILPAFISTSALASDERIAQLKVEIKNNRELRVSARLIRWANQDLMEEIHNGIPKDLFYTVVLKKRMPFWIDEELTSKTIKFSIKYDVLKKQEPSERNTFQKIHLLLKMHL